MAIKTRGRNQYLTDRSGFSLKNLSEAQVRMIDEALDAVGEFGEVHLIVQKGRLRFLVTQKSFDALKYRPGGISGGK